MVLNKVGTATPDKRDAARKFIVALNPDATLIETDFGRVDRRRFSAPAASIWQKPSSIRFWFKELHGFKDHLPKRGIRHPLFRLPRAPPVRSRALQRFIDRSCAGVVRARGFSGWQRARIMSGEISQAGSIVRTGKMGVLVVFRAAGKDGRAIPGSCG